MRRVVALVGEAEVAGPVRQVAEEVPEHQGESDPGAERAPRRRATCAAGAARPACCARSPGLLDQPSVVPRCRPSVVGASAGHLEEDLLEGAFGGGRPRARRRRRDQRRGRVRARPRRPASSSSPSGVRLTASSPADAHRHGDRRVLAASRAPAGSRSPRSSSTVDSRSSRPPLITPTRSQISCTSVSRWLDSSTVWPPRASDDDERAHVGHARRVESVGRLVEHDQLRVAQQRGGDAEALLHAERVRLEPVVCRGRRGRPAPAPSSTAWSPRSAVAGHHPQVVAPGEVGEEARSLDQRADPGDHLRASRRPPEDARRPGRGPDQSEQHPQGRRLAGPVRAEEAVDLAPSYGQADRVDGESLAVPSWSARRSAPPDRSWVHGRRPTALDGVRRGAAPAYADPRTREPRVGRTTRASARSSLGP